MPTNHADREDSREIDAGALSDSETSRRLEAGADNLAEGLPALPKRVERTESRSLAELAGIAMLEEEFERHRPKLLAMLERRIDDRLRARLDPEGLLHETFILASRRWGGFPETGMKPYPWLYRLALDTYLEAYDRETRPGRDARRDAPRRSKSDMRLCEAIMASGTTPGRALARKELQEAIADALERLDEDDREVLRMRFFDGLKVKEIAAILRIDQNAASKRCARALKRVQDHVPDGFKPEAPENDRLEEPR